MDTVFRKEHIFNYSTPYVYCNCMSNFIRPIRQYSILVCNTSAGGLSTVGTYISISIRPARKCATIEKPGELGRSMEISIPTRPTRQIHQIKLPIPFSSQKGKPRDMLVALYPPLTMEKKHI
jgi:hypothetical protein